jgi:hypothetical protein
MVPADLNQRNEADFYGRASDRGREGRLVKTFRLEHPIDPIGTYDRYSLAGGGVLGDWEGRLALN